MSTTWTEQRLSNWFITGLAESLREAVSKGPGASNLAAASLVPGEPRTEVWKAWTDPVWYSAPAEIERGAALFIGCSRGTALQLGGAASGDESGADADALASYEQLLNEAVTLVDVCVEEETGRPAQFTVFEPDTHPPFASLGIEYRFHLGEAMHLLAVAPSPALLEAVILVGAEEANGTGPGRSPGESDLSPAAAENLRMLMDVDLDLSVSFGKTRLLLQDVLKLSSGSIVELNRSANDPVDLLVNNSIVARGEVVVVDGNYGVRVTEVVSQKARIRSVM